MRGLKTLLVERHDLTAGATGRNHGLLHSGARYAVTDQESAEECIRENMILRKIARHCVEETDGLFITLPEDDLGFQTTFIDSCLKAGIRAEAIDPKEAIDWNRLSTRLLRERSECLTVLWTRSVLPLPMYLMHSFMVQKC